MISYVETPIQEIHDKMISMAGVKLLVKREDMNNADISGNKWWKLKYNLEEAIRRRAIYNLSRYKALALAPISVNELGQVAPASDQTVTSTQEKNDDRTGNIFVAEALRAFKVSRNAIRRLALACRVAVQKIGELDRASQSLGHATRIFEWIRPALIKRRGDRKSQSEGLKKGP